MIFDRGGCKLAENLPNGLKVSLELFRVRDFNRVDRVERVDRDWYGLSYGLCRTYRRIEEACF